MRKRAISLLLAVLMILSMTSFASAEDATLADKVDTAIGETEIDLEVVIGTYPAEGEAIGEYILFPTSPDTVNASELKEADDNHVETSNPDCFAIDLDETVIEETDDKITVTVLDDSVDNVNPNLDTESCTHKYGEWTTVNCATGEQERYCKYCGYKDTQNITPCEHSFGAWQTVDCETGEQARYCTVCYIKDTQTQTGTPGHNYVTIAATCTEEGCTYCKNCGKIKEIIPALGHDLDGDKKCKHEGCTYCEKGEADGVKYELSGTTLTVSGGTEIKDYVQETDTGVKVDEKEVYIDVPQKTPWDSFKEKVVDLVIGKTIKEIGQWAFAFMDNLKTVTIEGDGVQIDDYAFAMDENLQTVTFKGTAPTYENNDATVEYEGKQESGTTAFFGDGNVEIDSKCTLSTTQEKKYEVKAAFASVSYGDWHANTRTVLGYAPTEKKCGLSNGVYCDDCKQWVTPQWLIFPNGKKDTGTYDFAKVKNVDIKNALMDKTKEVYKEEAKKELKDNSYQGYDIKMTKGDVPKDGEKYIVTIPYPELSPAYYDFVCVEQTEDGTVTVLDVFETNRGAQVECEELGQFMLAWYYTGYKVPAE